MLNGFFCYHRKAEKIRKCTSSYTQKYMRAVLPVIQNKTEYSIDDILGEAIRDPAHSGAVAIRAASALHN